MSNSKPNFLGTIPYLFGACLCYIFMGINLNAGINYPTAPQDGKRVILVQSIVAREFHVSKQIDMEVSEPLQWYSVKTPDVASGRLLSSANTYTSTWIYILSQRSKVVGAATLSGTESPLKFSGLLDSSFGEKLQKALRFAENLPQLRNQVFEVRYLGAAPLNFFALWLHGKQEDLLLPLPPTFGRFNAYQSYSESQVITVLKPEAARDIVMDKKLDQ